MRNSPPSTHTISRELPPLTMPPSHALSAVKGGCSPAFEKGLGIEAPEDLDQRRHQPGPSCLVTGADAGPIVPMKILEKQQITPPVGIALKLFGAPEYRAPAGRIAQKDPGQPVGDLARDLEQVH